MHTLQHTLQTRHINNMQSVNKIHSTRISLNDRFTIIQTVQPNAAAASPRRRRSQSANSRIRSSPKSSLQNRRLLEQLDQKHMMRTALRLKKKSLRSNLPLRQRLNTQMKNRIMKRGLTATTLSVGPGGRLKRANSLRNIGTMQADLVGGGNLRRSNSALNLAGRLGVRGQAGGPNTRRRLIRNNVATQRSRSRSRSRTRPNLIRSNSQTNLRRSNSKQSLATQKRSNSQVRGRSASRQRPRLQRSNSRKNLNTGLRNRGNVAGANRRVGINGRLGVKQTQLLARNVQRGRIIKRRNSTANGKNGNIGTVGRNGARQRVARSRTRVAQSNPRNRSASRGRTGRQPNNNNFAPNNQQNNRSRQNGRGRGGGRSRSRGRPGRPNAGAATKQPVKTKEELDKELDQYMVNTKSNEIDIFMG
ncbi:putative uncharacterized protein DDB_G0286901 [Bradysia coprophila]|uniref:putative uncharacterized protein DDB_G0286901 n=1 Tax=Bradysia coprophila TaxID=38358 RepID=UPI00187DC097|nr:putative uncharacterized protein DDB_G0286901 [Bradysia coprophila]